MNISHLFSQIFGAASDHLPIDDPEVAQMVRVMSRVQMHLQGRWQQAQRMGISCEQHVRSSRSEVLRCVEPMGGTCVACRRPVCLHHCALVPDSGDLLCFGCIGLAQKSARERATAEPPNSEPSSSRSSSSSDAEDYEKLRKKYLRRLKLTGEPTEEEVKAAFKREAAKSHPDRAPAEKRKKAHEKFVALGEARDWLLENMRKRAA